MFSSDIIVAPATAVSDGGIAIVRVSGIDCLSFVEPYFKPAMIECPFQSHMMYYGHFISQQDKVVDEIMFVYMVSPRSYTGEDVVEIHCHGGRIVVRQILDILLEAGCRMAKPGEFTQRAFLNGRIDLAEAEAVADLIVSRSDLSAKIAVAQMDGSLSSIVYDYRHQIIQILALIEAYIDFPEDDINAPHISSISGDLDILLSGISSLIDGFEEGRIVRDGLSLLIMGEPNVGKSSILNQFLGEDRAIVTNIPGTTRDIIEESIVVSGLTLRFIDTAGIRDTDDPIELDGVRRARDKVSSADLILYVIDGTCSYGEALRATLLEYGDIPLIVLVNKSDKIKCSVPEMLSNFKYLSVSAKDGTGFTDLKEEILSIFKLSGSEERESFMVSDRRHRDALFCALSFLREFEFNFKSGLPPEFLSIHLRDALSSLGEITGETTPDDVLNKIFSRFCIGK
ncbi:MAG: tRNA uridine-5-carboxymethylaminomethyl(34) synthesis GTPase MnmE [Thermodesulfobacteriota bacterium]|nr:tRNA uridine-5-carboxymethylaminomethyl(34) synthesis GTPase MnmE [Thermodesulfobacteriota bacterium]